MIIKKKEGLTFHNIITATLRNALTGEIVQQIKQHNVVTDVGIGLILDILGGKTGTLYSAITYGAVGTGTTAADITDTTLETESARNICTYSRVSKTGTFSVFFNTGEANVTIAEIGFFGGNATSITDSGILFNRIKLASTIGKTSDYTLTIEVDIVGADA